MAAEVDLSKLKVVPGGQTIGVKLKSEGILIVGFHLIQGNNGQKQSKTQINFQPRWSKQVHKIVSLP
jgi:hypothetical protein